MKAKQLTLEERNAITWLQRQVGVTNVVPARKAGSAHRQQAGTTKIVKADAQSVTLRLFLTGEASRDLYVHAAASPDRDRWLDAIAKGSATQLIDAEPTKITHTVPKAESFSAEVPAPKPVDAKAAQTFDVTPALAAKWLERNTRNRPMRDATVLKYAADMREGKWMLVGDAIAFDTSGAIVNGQHRLWAVLEADVTVRMLVVFDLDPNVVYVLDDHLKRRIVDIIHIGQPGSTIQTKHTAIARAMMYPMTDIDAAGRMARSSRQRQVEFLDRHLDAIKFVIVDCFRNKAGRFVTNSNIMAIVARAFYTQDRERLKQFGQVVTTGVMESPNDRAAILLRNWLLSMETRNVRAQADTIRAKSARALWGFINGESARSLVAATTELFPLPEEQAPGVRLPKPRSART